MAEQTEWTVQAALDWTCDYLARKGDENPRLSAQWLLSEACGLSRVQLYVNFDKPLSSEERMRLHDFVKRRGQGEPLQYITGEVAFRHLALKIRPGVLIPRPETEVLVSEVLNLLPAPQRVRALDSTITAWQGDVLSAAQADMQSEQEDDQKDEQTLLKRAALQQAISSCASAEDAFEDPNVLTEQDHAPQGLLVADLCTGSGCIAASLAYEHPDIRVIATDISPEAVQLARENAESSGVSERMAVLECSLGQGIGTKRMGTFDAVVSNPPYIPTSVMRDLPREVADFEPDLALDGGADGLDLFRPLSAWAFQALKPGGFLACELYEGHLEEASAEAQAAGFSHTRIVKDLTDRPRILIAFKSV